MHTNVSGLHSMLKMGAKSTELHDNSV